MRFLCFFLIYLLISSSAFAAVSKITQLRLSHTNDVTRFVFDLSAPVKDYHISYHPSSQHLTLDIDQVTLSDSVTHVSSKHTLISAYTSQPSDKKGVRFNFELVAPVAPKVYTLEPSGHYSYRLVLDLKKNSIALDTHSSSVPDLQEIMANIQEKPALSHTASTNTASLKPQLVSSKKSAGQPIVIVIDPGHGGKDPGAVGSAGNREKDIVLSIAKILQAKFNKQKGYEAKLTRDRDVYIPLRQRLAIARKHKADFFVSIHADAYKDPSVKGASVFALSDRGATSEMARWLAQKENESELLDGVYASDDKVLRSVLLDLSQTHMIATSLDMGRSILNCLSSITHLHYRRVEQAAFVVLKSPDIPSLLVETGYISNPGQENQLISKAYQERIADAIVEGIKNYFSRHPHLKG